MSNRQSAFFATVRSIPRRLIKRIHRGFVNLRPRRWMNVGSTGRLLVDMRDDGGYQLFKNGAGWIQPLAITAWGDLVANNDWDLIIDVGANYGEFTVMAHHHNPNTPIIAIEPHPTVSSCLETTVATLANVQLLKTAAGARDGLLTLHIGRNSRHSSLAKRFGHFRTIEVPLAKVDEIVRQLELQDAAHGRVLVKIDVEGAEPDVMLGAKSTLLDAEATVILSEASFSDIPDTTTNWQEFSVFGINGQTAKLVQIETDTPRPAGTSIRDVVLTRGSWHPESSN